MAEVIPVSIKSKKSMQVHISVVIAVLFIFAAFLLSGFNQNAVLPYFFGFFFGFTLQRSRFCFAGCFRDIFLIRNTSLTRALLLAVALTSAGFIAVNFLPGGLQKLESAGKIFPVGVHTVAGGLIFGFGMVIAGSCVSGCLSRMGEGYIMQWYTFAGLLAGSALGAWNLGWWHEFSIRQSAAVFLPYVLGWPAAVLLHFLLIVFFYLLALRLGGEVNNIGSPKRKINIAHALFTKKWSYTTGAVMLAAGNTLLFRFWGHPWSITSGLTNLSGWVSCRVGLSPLSWAYFSWLSRCGSETFLYHPILYLALAMVVGSLFSSLLNSEFRLRRPKNTRYILSALIGGLLMGYSSRIVLGCNIGAFLSGTSSLSLHGWVFGLSLLPGAALGGKFLIRYLID
ncbi:MAG: YeeE/YedE family protein [Dethiobacter sp.]|jgi:uncharacterized membrane protein YedE/YeeE|nr:YeeE/YedE family protein [Dethiobacter sp.]